MKDLIYDYDAYKPYLNERLDNYRAGGGRGSRTKLSKSIGCQTAYTAQVLRGSAHFSLEQAEAINDFLGHSDEEGLFFLLLIQRERAGTKNLRRRFDQQIKLIRRERLSLVKRLKVVQPLGQHEQVTYYSAWYYAAIHALVSIPRFRGVAEISSYLQLDIKKVREAIEFLTSVGLLDYDSSKVKSLVVGHERIHLGADSPLIAKHHANWRLQALRALERPDSEDLHYSSAISISEADAARVREILIRTIETIKSIIKQYDGETAKCLSFDFFKI
jgi:uncharacterized protein (TIGR02147 family)